MAIGSFVLDLSQVKHLFNGPQLQAHQHVFNEVRVIIRYYFFIAFHSMREQRWLSGLGHWTWVRQVQRVEKGPRLVYRKFALLIPQRLLVCDHIRF